MPKIEVDEAEYNNMVALRTVAQKIVANPKARKMLESAQKEVDPNAATPTLDAEAQHLAPIREVENKLLEKLNAIEARDAEREKNIKLDALASKQTEGLARLRRAGYTDEGVAAIQKVMEDKGLFDVEDAVAIFERNNPPQTPVTPGGIGSWGFTDLTAEAGDSKDIAALIASKGESDQVADRMARNALNEFRGQVAHR